MAMDDRTKQRIIDMYRQGKKTAEITKATGAPRSTIYYLLNQEGITPRRKGGPRTSERPPLDEADSVKLEWAIKRITELDREYDTLRQCLLGAAERLKGGSAH